MYSLQMDVRIDAPPLNINIDGEQHDIQIDGEFTVLAYYHHSAKIILLFLTIFNVNAINVKL